MMSLQNFTLLQQQLRKENLLRKHRRKVHSCNKNKPVVDALLSVVARLKSDKTLRAKNLRRNLSFACAQATDTSYWTSTKRTSAMVLKIIARRSKNYVIPAKGYHFAYVHLNPNVKEPVTQLIGGLDNVYILIDPQPYLPFATLMNRADLILTDSGGIQKSPIWANLLLLMRETTERPEAVSSGLVKLVGARSSTQNS